MKNRWKIILICMLFLVGIVALGLYQSGLQGSAKKAEAKDYFEVVVATLDDAVVPNENSSVYKITQLTFRFKAVRGDAHNVVIYGWVASVVTPDDGLFPVLLKGEEQTISIQSDESHPYVSTMNEDGKLPVLIRIGSSEAEGKITLLLT